jgi:hypothetical protein
VNESEDQPPPGLESNLVENCRGTMRRRASAAIGGIISKCQEFRQARYYKVHNIMIMNVYKAMCSAIRVDSSYQVSQLLYVIRSLSG